jgi:hypothetical protein
MSVLARWRWARQGTGLLLAALAALLLAPVAARAGCGDYVVIGGKPPAVAQPDLHPPAASPQAEHAPALPPGGHAPCPGPLCSRGPTPLPLPPAPPAPSPAEKWDGTLLPPSLADTEPVAWLADDDTARPVRRGSGIYHPPR